MFILLLYLLKCLLEANKNVCFVIPTSIVLEASFALEAPRGQIFMALSLRPIAFALASEVQVEALVMAFRAALTLFLA